MKQHAGDKSIFKVNESIFVLRGVGVIKDKILIMRDWIVHYKRFQEWNQNWFTAVSLPPTLLRSQTASNTSFARKKVEERYWSTESREVSSDNDGLTARLRVTATGGPGVGSAPAQAFKILTELLYSKMKGKKKSTLSVYCAVCQSRSWGGCGTLSTSAD